MDLRSLATALTRGGYHDWAAQVSAAAGEIDQVRAQIDAVAKERDEARDWVRRMVRETQELRCAFCGETYPPGTPGANDDRLAAHIAVCPKHPMRAADARIATLEAALREALPIVEAEHERRFQYVCHHEPDDCLCYEETESICRRDRIREALAAQDGRGGKEGDGG